MLNRAKKGAKWGSSGWNIARNPCLDESLSCRLGEPLSIECPTFATTAPDVMQALLLLETYCRSIIQHDAFASCLFMHCMMYLCACFPQLPPGAVTTVGCVCLCLCFSYAVDVSLSVAVRRLGCSNSVATIACMCDAMALTWGNRRSLRVACHLAHRVLVF